MWNTKPTDVGAIDAALFLIQSCINNNEYVDARLYASTLYEIINHKHDNKIPDAQRQRYIATGASFLSEATLRLAKDGGIPPEEKQKAGREAIALARKALEIHTQLHEINSDDVANDMLTLAEILDHFNDDDDDEVLRLYEQAKTIFARLQGDSSLNVATAENKLGDTYYRRAGRAHAANDLGREMANLELALPRFREAIQIYRAVNRLDGADRASKCFDLAEDCLRQNTISRTAAETTTTRG